MPLCSVYAAIGSRHLHERGHRVTNATTQTGQRLAVCQARTAARTTRVARHWIDGEWRDSAEHRDSINPASGEKIGAYAFGKADEAAAAVAAAVRVFRDTDWRTNRERRVRVLNEMADRFEARTAELAEAIAAENGKILPEATFEAALAPPGLRYGAMLVSAHYGRAAEWEAGRISLLLREAVGVAGISVPWNSPVALLIRSLAPALAAGCTVVVKMPEETAQVNALVSEVMSEVKSLPPGVISMITGGREVLSYLVESPDVPTISFTGSTRTGRAISEAGAPRLKRFGLELGGKTPLIVFDDADLDVALPKIAKALTVFAGQFCMAGSRLLVQGGVGDRVRKRLGERLAKVKVGPASDPESEMGPLIDKVNVERVDRIVEEAIAAGARVIVRGGPIVDGPLAKGAFYRPTLLEVAGARMPIVQHEVFGPVMTLQVFDTEADAIALANDSEYGLAASIWSRDADRPLRIAREIQAGTVWINDWVVMRDEFEEGGYKQSGRGRLRGLASLADFVEYKHIVLQPGVAAR
jgi:betaine-aldehyde dehydrogenase